MTQRKIKIKIKKSKKKSKKKSLFKFIDLFCGIGGFHQAMSRLGGECVYACDINKDSRKVYETNYGLKPDSDIRKVDETKIPDFDVLCGGFPCQAFSNAGKKKSFQDKRGMLFENILRIAEHKKPKFMILENVRHIKKISNGEVFKHILNRIRETGYYIKDGETVFELSPHELGIPQQRVRVIFVCIRNDLYDKTKDIRLNIPDVEIDFSKIIETDKTKTDPYKIDEEIVKLLNAWDEMVQVVDVGDKLSPTIMCNEFHSVYTPEEFSELPAWKQDYITKNKPIYNKYKTQWDSWYERHKTLLTKKAIYGKLEWQTGKKKQGDTIWNYFIQLRQSGIRVKRARYFPTLVAIVQTPIYAKEKRAITPRECARLQSFPDTFILHEKDRIAYKQFGNAVNVDVIYTVAEVLFRKYMNVFSDVQVI